MLKYKFMKMNQTFACLLLLNIYFAVSQMLLEFLSNLCSILNIWQIMSNQLF